MVAITGIAAVRRTCPLLRNFPTVTASIYALDAMLDTMRG